MIHLKVWTGPLANLLLVHRGIKHHLSDCSITCNLRNKGMYDWQIMMMT